LTGRRRAPIVPTFRTASSPFELCYSLPRCHWPRQRKINQPSGRWICASTQRVPARLWIALSRTPTRPGQCSRRSTCTNAWRTPDPRALSAAGGAGLWPRRRPNLRPHRAGLRRGQRLGAGLPAQRARRGVGRPVTRAAGAVSRQLGYLPGGPERRECGEGAATVDGGRSIVRSPLFVAGGEHVPFQ
jgi:hypothetical protein